MKENGRSDALQKFVEGWEPTMVDIWKEKLRILDVRDTGNLYNSVQKGGIDFLDGKIIIKHSFVEYGIYVDAGVGSGYKHDNGGDLGFHPLREPKPWFNKKYYASLMSLRDAVADIIGKDSMMCITSALK